jgi:hypothetical protein
MRTQREDALARDAGRLEHDLHPVQVETQFFSTAAHRAPQNQLVPAGTDRLVVAVTGAQPAERENDHRHLESGERHDQPGTLRGHDQCHDQHRYAHAGGHPVPYSGR